MKKKWPLFIEKSGHVVKALRLQEILADWRKGIQQSTGFQAHAAVHNIGLFVQRIACTDDVLLFTNGELEFAGQHVG